MTSPMQSESSNPGPTALPHFDLLVALATKGAFAIVMASVGGGSQVRVVRGKRAGTDIERPHRPTRAGFPLANLATAHSAGHIVEAGEIARYALSATGRGLVRRWRASLGAARAAMVAMDTDMTAHAASSASGKPVMNEAESPLVWLSRRLDRDRRPLITPVQLSAGDRLRADLYLAHLTPRTTQSWNCIPQSRSERRGPPAPASAMSDSTVAARQRVIAAFDAVGSKFADMLIDVCGHLIGLEEIEKRRAWPARSAKLILQAALTELARHYGLLPRPDMLAVAQAKLRHWGADDFRPSLQRQEFS